MERLTIVLWVAAALVVVLMGYIRLAPSDPADWHETPGVSQNKDLARGVTRRIDAGKDAFARLDAIIRAAPRTEVLAGSVRDGMITYVTRSKIFGFPDYTTMNLTDDAIEIHARLRFGLSDMGVNRDRVDDWLAALQAR